MKAVYIKEFGGAENLEIREVENPPQPKDTEVLVSVKASAVNRADILQRKGFYPAPKGFSERILGLEFAGEVVEIGENVENFKIGDRVFGITAGAAQAEFLLTEESLLAKIPDESFICRSRRRSRSVYHRARCDFYKRKITGKRNAFDSRRRFGCRAGGFAIGKGKRRESFRHVAHFRQIRRL